MADKVASFLQMIRRDRRGRLKIYLGYAAGVGKTYQMLLEGQRLKADGVDIVVGLVETHGRSDTAQLLDGLELVLPRRIEYHGITLEEMDLDAVLARRPEVALVDELAHTNAPGSRNGKRYQDVQEILAAGINVIATLNVQHLESLYDTVERATGVQVKERLPDAVLTDADQVVNVDVSPEDLQKRLRAGKIYPLARVTTALSHFFQDAHLEQLRELTLRELAAQLDAKRRESADDKNRAGADQVMVCLGSRPRENAVLLRYGSRTAGRLNRNWYAVHVQTLQDDALTADAAQQRQMADILTLANQLGATVFTFKGEKIADAILRFAQEYRIGYVIIGKPSSKSRWRRLFGQNDVAGELLRDGEDFNLIVINPRGNAQGQPVEETSGPILSPVAAAAPIAEGGLGRWVHPGAIRVWRDPIGKEQAMGELTRALAETQAGLDPEKVLVKLRERESQGSTFLNEGIALPHARIDGLEAPLVALGLCQGGVVDAQAAGSIEVVFLLLSPQEQNRSHLQLLATAARLMQNRGLRKQLANARDAEEAYAILRAWDGSG